METWQVLIVVIQILMGIISLIGGSMLMSMQNAIRDLRGTDEKLAESMKECARNDEVKEWRREMRDEAKQWREEQSGVFTRIFDKLEEIQKDVSKKVDRKP